MAEESAPELVPLTSYRRNRFAPGCRAKKEAEHLLSPPELFREPDPRVRRRAAAVPGSRGCELRPAPLLKLAAAAVEPPFVCRDVASSKVELPQNL